MPRPLHPLVSITLGCALLAGLAVTAATASATTLASGPVAEPSITAAGLAVVAIGEKAPTSIEQALELVRARAFAQRDAASTGTAPGSIGTRSAVAARAEDTEPTLSASEPTADPVPPPLPEPPPVDTTPPTGTFVLSTAGLWTGQTLTLTQLALADDLNDPAGIERVVSWGDGSVTTLEPGATKATKSYAKKGKFTVSVSLKDAAGNTSTAKITKPAVTVTVPGVTFKLSKKAVWHHESFKVTISKVPSGTSKITLDRGDGSRRTLKGKNQSVVLSYYKQSTLLVSPGKITLRAILTNKNGVAAPVTVGRVTLKKDSWRPTVKITKPAKSKATKASAWSTIRGTAADKGSGVRRVESFAIRMNRAGDGWCFTTKKKWLKLRFEDENQNLVPCVLSAKVSKGKWSYKLKGLKKGYALGLSASAFDWVDKASSMASIGQVLTRN